MDLPSKPLGGRPYLQIRPIFSYPPPLPTRQLGRATRLPEPPETIKALTRARNRAAALEATCGGGFGLFSYEREALLERGELVPVSWIHPIEDMSE